MAANANPTLVPVVVEATSAALLATAISAAVTAAQGVAGYVTNSFEVVQFTTYTVSATFTYGAMCVYYKLAALS